MGVSNMNQNISNVKELVLYWIKNTRIPLTEISKTTGISRSTLYNWIEGKPIRDRNCEKILDVYKDEINIVNERITLKEGNVMLDIEKGKKETEVSAKYIIQLQKDKIEMQQKEIEELGQEIRGKNSNLVTLENNKKLNNEIFENTIPDMQEIVYVKGILKNDIYTKHCNNIGGEKLLEALGIPITDKDKYFAPNAWYKVHEHPIDQFIVKKSQKDLRQMRKLALEIFKGVKFIMGLDCLFVPVTYQHENNIVHTHTSLKFNLDMKNSHIVSKTIIIGKEKSID